MELTIMDSQGVTKQLRNILFCECDCDAVGTAFERVLSAYGLSHYEMIIEEDSGVMLVDIPNCIQYIKSKGSVKKIYELVPVESPLYNRSKNYDRRKRIYGDKHRKHRTVCVQS